MMEIMSKRNVTSHILALLLLLQLSNAFDNGGLTKIITTTHRINNKFLNGSNYRVVDLLESSTFNNKHSTSSSITRLRAWGSNNEEDLEEKEEEARLKVLESRRKTIRSALKSAESLKNFRVNNGFVPDIDEETGKPIKSDSKLALTLSAFVVAAGAVTLRVGGRAALVSGLGLDFANGNPELKESMDQFLSFASSLGDGTEALLFVLAWTFVKVFCFDAGGIVLALSSGILFGGVLQGAFFSAFAATVGSSVAYFLAKVDSPFRNKALEILEEYPSLRGIEKVVAQDGLKAVLTLRLAPILPFIPIGAYNYVYGVTNVPFWDFAGGIFLGSLKPYLLDSYLGYFGKEVIEGTAGNGGGIQDVILLVALGVSVLIGVFASQLAGETWDSISDEIEADKKKKDESSVDEEEADDGIIRTMFGFELPLWVVGAQISLREAEERMEEMIDVEFKAAVWNCTDENPPPFEEDPSNFPNSPEITTSGKGFDVAAAICDGLVLSPCLTKAYFKYADPLYVDTDELPKSEADEEMQMTPSSTIYDDKLPMEESREVPHPEEDYLLESLRMLRDNQVTKLKRIEKELSELK